jgi:hypothetical protein
MHLYAPALEAAAPTVFMVWLRAWRFDFNFNVNFIYILWLHKNVSTLNIEQVKNILHTYSISWYNKLS